MDHWIHDETIRKKHFCKKKRKKKAGYLPLKGLIEFLLVIRRDVLGVELREAIANPESLIPFLVKKFSSSDW